MIHSAQISLTNDEIHSAQISLANESGSIVGGDALANGNESGIAGDEGLTASACDVLDAEDLSDEAFKKILKRSLIENFIKYDTLHVSKIVTSGFHGTIFYGELPAIAPGTFNQPVAIKQMVGTSHQRAFFNEFFSLCFVDSHPNVVRLIGWTDASPLVEPAHQHQRDTALSSAAASSHVSIAHPSQRPSHVSFAHPSQRPSHVSFARPGQRNTGLSSAAAAAAASSHVSFAQQSFQRNASLTPLTPSTASFAVDAVGGSVPPNPKALIYEWASVGCAHNFLWSQWGESSEPADSEEYWMLVARIAADLFSGLAYVHQTLELLHRDAKVANGLIEIGPTSPNDTFFLHAKLCDFGFACKRTEAFDIRGTAVFIAPEMTHGGLYDDKVDVYSLALSFIELCWPRSIYDIDNILRCRPAYKPATYEELWPASVPAVLVDLLLQCCKELPQDRPTADEVAQTLTNVLIPALKNNQKQPNRQNSEL